MWDVRCHPLTAASEKFTLRRDSGPEAGKTGPRSEVWGFVRPWAPPAGAGATGNADSDWAAQRPLPQHLGQSGPGPRPRRPSSFLLPCKTVGRRLLRPARGSPQPGS